MTQYVLRRLLAIIPALLAMTLITFVVMHAIPGSPFDPAAFGGNDVPPEAIARIEAKYGLDKPLPVQYLGFLVGAVQGDFGYSFASKSRTVNELLGETFPVSLQLGSMAFVLALGIGVPLGILAAARHNGVVDYTVRGLTIMGVALPSFVISVLLILFFSLTFKLFPAASVKWQDPRAWVLPTIALAWGPMTIFARYTRAGMLLGIDAWSAVYVDAAYESRSTWHQW